jgi:nucleotide-binding universal stress UspA family protein
MTDQSMRLLVASDGSSGALEAARCAIGLAAACSGLVRLVLATQGEVGGQGDSRTEEDETRATTYVVRLGSEKGVDVEVQMVPLNGRAPYEVILEMAGDWDPDFIFMGRTGRHGPGRALMGSQTEHVLEFSDCPVVVVPGRS